MRRFLLLPLLLLPSASLPMSMASSAEIPPAEPRSLEERYQDAVKAQNEWLRRLRNGDSSPSEIPAPAPLQLKPLSFPDKETKRTNAAKARAQRQRELEEQEKRKREEKEALQKLIRAKESILRNQ